MGQKQELDWTDFPSLIRSIAARDHDGVIVRIAAELDVSSALLNQWVHGLVKSPSTKNLYKLSQRYDIPFLDLVEIVAQRVSRPQGKAPRRQGRRIGSLLLALAAGAGSMLGWPSGGVAAQLRSLPVAQVIENKEIVSLIGLWLRRMFRPSARPMLFLPTWSAA